MHEDEDVIDADPSSHTRCPTRVIVGCSATRKINKPGVRFWTDSAGANRAGAAGLEQLIADDTVITGSVATLEHARPSAGPATPKRHLSPLPPPPGGRHRREPDRKEQ